ncbi:ATP-binding protein [Streptomyces sp. ME03-5709C]|nr:ATP-binding protein [Streptomyces sp. ME03-5709C]
MPFLRCTGEYDERNMMDTVDAGRRPGRRALTAETQCWALPYRSDAPAQARGLAREALRRWGVPSATAGEVLLVVSELVTNAFEYARPPMRGRQAAATPNTAGAC